MLPELPVDPPAAEPWMDDAACAEVDPELWFPEKGGSTVGAKRVCAACSVAAECLAYALEHEERFGIWGGLSERERRRLRSAREDVSARARAGRLGAAAMHAKRVAS